MNHFNDKQLRNINISITVRLKFSYGGSLSAPPPFWGLVITVLRYMFDTGTTRSPCSGH